MDPTALAAAKARAAAVAAKYAGGHGSNSGGGSAGNTGSNNTPLGSGTLTGNGDSASDAAKRAQMIAERLGMNLPPSSKRAAPDRLENGPSKRKRVDIPEPDKPGINYSGLIIGPRGSTQKYLEQQSGCRILLRGQGTNQNPNYQDDDEPLHVTIEGASDEGIRKAEELIHDIIDNPDRWRSNQFNRGGNDDHYGPGANSHTEKLAVPNTCVGTIIGKGGETIRSLQQRSGAHIQLQRDAETPVGATERTVTISGSQENVEQAKQLLEELVKEQEEQTVRYRRNDDQENSYQPVANLQITVPNDRVGLIIGTRGRTIAGIQERTSARIQIPKGPDVDDPSQRTITITAPTHEAATAAQQEVEIVTQGGDNPGVSIPTVYVDVPDDKVGSVIGKGGATIRDIQERTGTKIQIPQQPDFTGIRKVAIRGTESGCEQAQQEVVYIVQTAPGANAHGQGGGYGAQFAPAPAYGGGYAAPGMDYAQQYPYYQGQPQDMAYQMPYQQPVVDPQQQMAYQQPVVDPQQQQQQMAQQPGVDTQQQQPVAQPTVADGQGAGAQPAATQDPTELWRQYEAYYAQFGWRWDYENNQWAPIEGFNPASAPATATTDTGSVAASSQPAETSDATSGNQPETDGVEKTDEGSHANSGEENVTTAQAAEESQAGEESQQ